MIVRDYMFKDVCTTLPDQTLKEAIKKMIDNNTNSMIVVNENNEPIGTVSSYTIIREAVPEYLRIDPNFSQFESGEVFDKYADTIKDKKVGDIMHDDYHTLKETDTMVEAAAHSVKASRRISPVVDDSGRLSGIITRTSVRNALYNILYKDDQADPKSGG